MNTFDPQVKCHHPSFRNRNQKSCIWTEHAIAPFDELLISWNADRPEKGQFVILVSLLHREWSPWLLYAVWGSKIQYSFHETTSQSPIQTYQDQVEILDGEKATGYRIRVEASGGATLADFHSFFACTCIRNVDREPFTLPIKSVEVPVVGISQLQQAHPRSNCFCSPSSITSMIHTLSPSSKVSPLSIASSVYDSGFDIYGNWPFNTAQLYVHLQRKWSCYVARLKNFSALFNRLNRGLLTIVSVKGPLPGSLKNYNSGHLLVVRGYDASQNIIHCMDPAYPTDKETLVSYPLKEFHQAWEKRGNIAYIIDNTDRLKEAATSSSSQHI